MSADLRTRYLGLALEHPIVASASPLTATLDGIRALEDAGAAAVVMASLYEEQIRAEDTAYAMYTDLGSFSQAEAGGYFPVVPGYDAGVSGHVDTLRRAVEAVDIPVIASLNAVTMEGWTGFARDLEQAGAAALELNPYSVPADVDASGETIEARYVDIVREVRRAVKIPIAVKVAPYFSSPGHMARRLVEAGADGLVLFNRFYQPDFDLVTLAAKSDLRLSSRHESGLPLLWIALLAGRLGRSLAATTGVETVEQVVKYLLAGADAVMTTSALLRNGPGYMHSLVADLTTWLEQSGHDAVAQMRGLKSLVHEDNVAAVLRSQYMRLLTEYVPAA